MDDFITLKPQDVVVLLKIVSFGPPPWTQANLAKELRLHPSAVSQSLARLYLCNLYNKKKQVALVEACGEFLIHGIRYVFPAHRGKIVRGIPTAAAAPPLNKVMDSKALNWPPVWTTPNGSEQGYSIPALVSDVDHIPDDPKFYELIALVDALREGRARERTIASEELLKRLHQYKVDINQAL